MGRRCGDDLSVYRFPRRQDHARGKTFILYGGAAFEVPENIKCPYKDLCKGEVVLQGNHAAVFTGKPVHLAWTDHAPL